LAIKTYTEQLEEVQAAITAIEGGSQSYTINGRSLERGDLDTLYKREAYLRTQVSRESAGGGARVRGVTVIR
jgi:hypothetical protein